MAEKKSKIKAAAAGQKSVATKSTPAKSAAVKGAASKGSPSKPASAKAVAAKAASSKPTALQTVARKPASPKSNTAKPVKAASKSAKTTAKRVPLNGRAQSAPPRPATPDSQTFYLVVSHLDARISDQKSPSGAEIASSSSFDEVKDKAVDHLIALVDLLERRLWEIKRSQDFASYQALLEVE